MTYTPILYILCRNDLESMNPGKLAAQVAHAGIDFQIMLNNTRDGSIFHDLYKHWLKPTIYGYGGTVVVLEATVQEIGALNYYENDSFMSNTWIDPEYPLKDGTVVHKFPLITCGWIFGDKDEPELKKLVSHLKLYP